MSAQRCAVTEDLNRYLADRECEEAFGEAVSERVNATIAAMTFGEKREEGRDWNCARTTTLRARTTLAFREWLAERLHHDAVVEVESAIAGDRQDAAEAAAESRREMEWDS